MKRPENIYILIGCEESQEVCKAFRARGFNAFSCDLKPCSGDYPEWHLQMDIIKAISLRKWHVLIYFPECTYICLSGLHWNKRISGRTEKTEEGLQFVCRVYNIAKRSGVNHIGFENPKGCINTRIIKDNGNYLMVIPHDSKRGYKPTQVIQPYEFGDDASKATCLWLTNLPYLQGTQYVQPRFINGKKRWSNQTDSGQNKLPPSEKRAELRSKTYPGIAAAMAQQWGDFLLL